LRRVTVTRHISSWYPTSHSGQLSFRPLSRTDISTGYGQSVAVLCDWEGNRTSGVALAMRHRLSFIFVYNCSLTVRNKRICYVMLCCYVTDTVVCRPYRINGIVKADEHHTHTFSQGTWHMQSVYNVTACISRHVADVGQVASTEDLCHFHVGI